MTYETRLLFKAEVELAESWRWYERAQLGLGDRFENAVYKKIELIAKNPLHYQKRGRYREALTDDFPFLIIYSLNRSEKRVSIVSIFHTSRSPGRKYL